MKHIVDTAQYLDMVCAMLAQGNADVPVPVRGVSMRPFLRDEDRVFLNLPEGPIRKGDILLFRRIGGRYILHRVMEIHADGSLVMLGDSQMIPETIPPEAVCARVSWVSARGKEVRPGSFRWWFYAHPWRLMAPWRRQIGKIRSLIRRT